VAIAEAPSSTVALLRRGVLGLGALALIATGLELAMEQHWKQPSQLIPWASLALSAIAIVLLVRHSPTRLQVRIAQVLAVLVILSAAFGVFQHAQANYESAPLDFRFSETWDSLSEVSRLWIAVTHQVGPSPTLAPLALAYASVCVLLATLRHSALDLRQQ